MLYKYSFSILCGHLNLNKKIEFDVLPVKPTGKPVKPFAQRILNSNLISNSLNRFPTKPVRYTDTGPAGLAGPVGKVNPARAQCEQAPTTHRPKHENL
jgi:hypothetical protein